MRKYNITRRSISDAVYIRSNPNGDPFTERSILTKEDAQLYGLGIGLYWGEGNKRNKYSIRLGNTDAALIRTFIKFLLTFFDINQEDLRFSLQIFTDIDPEEALLYWSKELNVDFWQFHKPVITLSGSIGTYREKSKYGVVTVVYNNKKLRDIMLKLLPR